VLRINPMATHAATKARRHEKKRPFWISCFRVFVAIVLVAYVASGFSRTALVAQAPGAAAAKEQRLKWFREAKYGLFIHWGLYALPAGEWNGRTVPGLGEWIMFRAPVPVREYEQLAARFNPIKYHPDERVQLAQDAGMKYIVITSKHHDG